MSIHKLKLWIVMNELIHIPIECSSYGGTGCAIDAVETRVTATMSALGAVAMGGEDGL